MNMVKQEWVNLFRNKILLISVIAITFIPILYSSIFDKSVWDPYGSTKYLPVAVVNEDKPVEMMGQKLDVGSQVVDNLKDNKDLDWNFVSRKEAEKGLKDLKYYMVITIPEDFSKNAASVVTTDPKQMDIIYTTNGSLNYIAETISTIAASTLESQVRQQVVEAYAEAVVEAGKQLIAGLQQAADGSSQLASGTTDLESGLTQYTSGVGQVADGSEQLSEGTSQLLGSVGPLISGVTQLDDGASELSSALNQIDAKVRPFENNIGQLDAGLVELANGAQNLSNALAIFENNLDPATKNQLDAQLTNLQNQAENLLTNSAKLTSISIEAVAVSNQAQAASNSLNGVSAKVETAETNINNTITTVINGSEQISEEAKPELISTIAGAVSNELAIVKLDLDTQLQIVQTDLNKLSSDAEALAQGANEIGVISGALAESAESMKVAINEIQSGVNILQASLNQVPSSTHANNLVAGLNQVSADLRLAASGIPAALAGVNQLADGSSQLSSGLGEMRGQMPELASGVEQLDSGADQLKDGLTELNANSPELMSGIDQLNDGAKELAKALVSGADEATAVKLTQNMIDQFAAPTNLEQEQYSKVSNYGEALAPYIMSLALFVGCMLFNFVYPIRKVSLTGQTSGDWWLSKTVLGIVVSSVMAVVQATIMLLIGLPVDNLGQFYLTAFVSAWSYMALTMFLAMTFDNPGRFVAMIILVLQLGGAGGTFPIQLQGKFYQDIHPYLPMSYSVYAFRNAITGGIGDELFKKSIIILFVLFIVFYALLRVSMDYLQKHHLQNVSVLNDNQELMALEDQD